MLIRVGITGHRKLEDPYNVRESIQLAVRNILKDYKSQGFEAYTSLASGADSIFAEVALQMGAMIKVVLPMPASAYLNDFDTNGATLFTKLLENDLNPVIVTETIPQTAEERDEAYLKAGECVVNNCDVLIAVWDGEISGGKGGTADIVDLARKANKPLKHIKAFRSDISRLFIQNDKLAIHLKKVYQRFWKTSIILSLSAAIILAVSVSFVLSRYKFIIALIELICIILAVSIILFLKQGRLNKDRIRVRRIAERLRVLERFKNSNISIEKLEYFEDLPGEINDIEQKYQSTVLPHLNFIQSRNNLLQLVDEQIHYHTTNRPEIRGKTFHFLEKIQFPLLIVFFFSVILHFVSVAQENKLLSFLPHIPHWLGLILCLSIPPVYAAIEGYIYFKEYHKIFIDSEKMNIFFKGIRLQIESIDPANESNFEQLNKCAYLIMKNMDNETKEWVFIMETKRSPGL